MNEKLYTVSVLPGTGTGYLPRWSGITGGASLMDA